MSLLAAAAAAADAAAADASGDGRGGAALSPGFFLPLLPLPLLPSAAAAAVACAAETLPSKIGGTAGASNSTQLIPQQYAEGLPSARARHPPLGGVEGALPLPPPSLSPKEPKNPVTTSEKLAGGAPPASAGEKLGDITSASVRSAFPRGTLLAPAERAFGDASSPRTLVAFLRSATRGAASRA